MRTDRRARCVTILLATSLAGGCNKGTPLPVVGPSPSPVPPATTVIKVVPSETPFAVALVTELSSESNRPGETFRANVVTPLQSDDGDTIVPAEAELVGTVISVSPAPDPAILIRFDAVETRWGPRSLRATVTRAQPQASVGGDRPRFAGYDGAIRPAPGIPLLTSDVPATAQVIDLPPGARLRMVLTDSLAIRAHEPNVPFAPPSP
jgi:hypothetical protein